MNNSQTIEFTQKDLLKAFMDFSQHAATREELQITKKEIIEYTDKRFEQLIAETNTRFNQVDNRFEQVDKRFDRLELKVSEISKKQDKFMWLMFTGMLAIFFKTQLLALFS